jgi:nicotinate-nucleotide pyrophosphorylase (carboxylating)
MQNTSPNDINELVRFCLQEDIGDGDITAELIPAGKTANAIIISRESGVFCGRPWVEAIFQQIDRSLQLNWNLSEGAEFEVGQELVEITGSARSILTGERTALNFLQTLSATASLSRHYSALVAHTSVKLLDTRKTLPGLRHAQKYAVKLGGCFNHRMGLYDAFLIKENHISACGGIAPAIAHAKTLQPGKAVEVEVQNLDELSQAISAQADIIMLDNFSIAETVEAVSINAGACKLEASGGIDRNRLVSIAETGIDYISLGALTKNCQAIDLSLLLRD